MLGGLYGLNLTQHTYLSACQVLPVAIAGVGMYALDDGLVTLAMIDAAYVLLPQIYIRYLSKEGELAGILIQFLVILAYFINEFRTKSQQVRQGLSLCASAFGMVLLSYAFTYVFDDEMTTMVHFPLSKNWLYLTAFFLIFSLINPFLEEWFWRIFLMKTYKENWQYRLLINSSYTALHFMVLCKVFDMQWQIVKSFFTSKQAAGFSTYFYSVGRAFEFIRSKHGLIACLLTHYGMTFASAAVMGVFIAFKNTNI